jgi:hypothetical protein
MAFENDMAAYNSHMVEKRTIENIEIIEIS